MKYIVSIFLLVHLLACSSTKGVKYDNDSSKSDNLYIEGEEKKTEEKEEGENKVLEISKEELQYIGELIYQNETSGRKEYLVTWNEGEEFASLGIGHFIWYPKNYNGPFDEKFPQYIEYYKQNVSSEVPKIVEKNKYFPWNSREEFLKNKSTDEINELITFLENTKDIQVMFIYERLESSLDKLLEATNKKKHVQNQFYRVAESKNGLYPLIDYINFKGEGTKNSEKYNGEGWGMLQVLENMNGSERGNIALKNFSDQGKFVLDRRIANSPKERNEERWREGWYNRLDTYYK